MQKGGNLFCCTPFGTERQYFLNYFIPQHSLGYTLMPMQGFIVGMQGFIVGMQGFIVGMQGFSARTDIQLICCPSSITI